MPLVREMPLARSGVPSCTGPQTSTGKQPQKIGGRNAARKLRDPVRQRVKRGKLASDPESDRDRGIEMAAGDVAERTSP